MMIFFDIDQTLIDQRKAEAAAARELLAVYHDSLGRNYSVVSFCRIWDFLRDKHARAFFAGVITSQGQRRLRVRELFGRTGWELSDREADDCFALYERHYRRHWTLFDDVLPCSIEPNAPQPAAWLASASTSKAIPDIDAIVRPHNRRFGRQREKYQDLRLRGAHFL